MFIDQITVNYDGKTKFKQHYYNQEFILNLPNEHFFEISKITHDKLNNQIHFYDINISNSKIIKHQDIEKKFNSDIEEIIKKLK